MCKLDKILIFKTTKLTVDQTLQLKNSSQIFIAVKIKRIISFE